MEPYHELKRMLQETPEAERLIVSQDLFNAYFMALMQNMRYAQEVEPDTYSWGPIEFYPGFTLQRTFTTFRGKPIVVLRWT